MSTQGNRYILYARKSSEPDDKQVLSLDSQVTELTDLSKKRDIRIVRKFEEAQSAKEPGRPLFNEMMAMIHAGKADGILCWKLDRLARNPIDGGQIQWALQQGVVQSILTPSKEYLPSDNVLLMNVEFGMANQYVLDLSQNVKRGVRVKVKDGHYPGVPPQGYLNDMSNPQGERTIMDDSERLDMVKKMWSMLLSGLYSPAQILKIANEEWGYRTVKRRKKGGAPLSPSSIYEMFRNPFYYGYFYWGGELHRGVHTAIITEEEFWRAQELLGKKGRHRPRDKDWAYTGLIRCGECGGLVTAEEKRKQTKQGSRFYHYYHCGQRSKTQCPQPSVTVTDLEEQIDEFLETITITDGILKWGRQYIREAQDREAKDWEQTYENRQQAYKGTQQKLNRLMDMWIDGLLTDEKEFRTKKADLERQRDRHKEYLEDANDRAKRWFELVEQTLEFANTARSRFNDGTNEDKRLILATVGSNLVLKDKKLLIEPDKPFLAIRENRGKGEWRARPDSNRRSPP